MGKIVHPEETEFSGLIVVILVLSILVKLYMYFYNHMIGKKLDSAAMQATAIDSLSDTCATTAVLAATLIGHFTGLHIDGWCGVLVGVFILYAGISAAKETLNPLLGQPPAEDFVMQIDRIVMSHPEICGIHDLICLLYTSTGAAGRCFFSAGDYSISMTLTGQPSAASCVASSCSGVG